MKKDIITLLMEDYVRSMGKLLRKAARAFCKTYRLCQPPKGVWAKKDGEIWTVRILFHYEDEWETARQPGDPEGDNDYTWIHSAITVKGEALEIIPKLHEAFEKRKADIPGWVHEERERS